MVDRGRALCSGACSNLGEKVVDRGGLQGLENKVVNRGAGFVFRGLKIRWWTERRAWCSGA